MIGFYAIIGRDIYLYFSEKNNEDFTIYLKKDIKILLSSLVIHNYLKIPINKLIICNTIQWFISKVYNVGDIIDVDAAWTVYQNVYGLKCDETFDRKNLRRCLSARKSELLIQFLRANYIFTNRNNGHLKNQPHINQKIMIGHRKTTWTILNALKGISYEIRYLIIILNYYREMCNYI